jgi:hypothetical protein
MIRTITVIVVLVILVGLYFWAGAQGEGVTYAPVNTPLNSVSLAPVQIGTSTANAQQTATADILLANGRATFSAATSTQYAVQSQAALQQTQVMQQQTQDQLNFQLTADWATVNAGATETQAPIDATALAAAAIHSAQTQSAFATQQKLADRLRQSEAQTQEMIAFAWTWGPPLLLVVLVAVGIWAIWYWGLFTRFVPDIIAQVPVLTHKSLPQAKGAKARKPEPKVVTQAIPTAQPGNETSGWMDEVKEELRASQKEDDVNPKP